MILDTMEHWPVGTHLEIISVDKLVENNNDKAGKSSESGRERERSLRSIITKWPSIMTTHQDLI